MNKLRNLLIPLLLVALLCVSGCNSTPADSAAPTLGAETDQSVPDASDIQGEPQPEEEEEPEPEPPTAAEIYASAVEKLNQTNDIKMDVELQTTRFVSGEIFETDETFEIEATDLSGDSPTMHVGRYLGMESGNKVWHLYHDGSKAYYVSQDANFCSEINYEDFAATQLPILLCTAENYGLIEFAPSDTTSITFSDASVPESWAAAADAKLITAQACVTLDADGVITNAEYTVEYSLGGVDYLKAYTVEYIYEIPDLTEDFASLVETEFITISDLRIPELVHYAYDGLFSDSFSTRGSQIITSYAAGAVLAEENSAAIYENDEGFGFTESYSMGYNLSGETGLSSYDSEYKDGLFTMTVDGETTEFPTVTPLSIRNAAENSLTRFFPSNSAFASLELKDAGSCWLIEFEFTPEHSAWLSSFIQQTLFEDADLLDELATDYRVDFSNGFISIEKDSLLPSALFIDFSATHTIEGQECPLLIQVSVSTTMADPFAYKNVNDRLAEAEEPEQKATPLLYEVTAPDGAKMWLFGTIHIGDERTLWLPEEVYTAFDNSDALAVECDVQQFEIQIQEDEYLQNSYIQAMTYTDGSTIEDHISPELYEQASVLMKAVGQFQNSATFKPMVWSSSITGAWLDHGRTLSSEYGVDNMLLDRARAQEKEILEVESVLFQASMTGGFSDELQELNLENDLDGDFRSYQEGCAELFELWCSGDEAALMELLGPEDTSDMTLEELALYNEYNDAMIIDRNHDMTQTAIEYMESGKTVFFAVGLAHLIGEDGMVFALRDAGYTVELISYSE